MGTICNAMRLELCRKKAGLSRQHLGELIGVHANTIKKWEYGESSPVSRQLLPLASVLGTTVAYLSGETDTPERSSGEVAPPHDLDDVTMVSVPTRAGKSHGNPGYGRALVYEHDGERIEIPTTKRGYELFEKLILSRQDTTVTIAG